MVCIHVSEQVETVRLRITGFLVRALLGPGSSWLRRGWGGGPGPVGFAADVVGFPGVGGTGEMTDG